MTDIQHALWDLVNGITAFAAIQTLAFVFVLLKPESAKLLATPFAVRWIRIFTPAFLLMYLVGVCGCFLLAVGWPEFKDRDWCVWFLVTLGRSGVVTLFCAIPIVSTFGARDLSS